MKRGVALVLLLVAACGREAVPRADTPGDRLERAAAAAGIVRDPARSDPVGLYARDTDRVCVVRDGGGYRIGAAVTYDVGAGCAASGSAARDGAVLHVRLNDCRFDAGFDGERIVFPAELPAACAAACGGRATLAALAADRLSDSGAEAAGLTDAGGHALCGSN